MPKPKKYPSKTWIYLNINLAYRFENSKSDGKVYGTCTKMWFDFETILKELEIFTEKKNCRKISFK